MGRTDTMLPVVQKPPESMQMPLGLSLRMDIIASAVTEPESRRPRAERLHKSPVKTWFLAQKHPHVKQL